MAHLTMVRKRLMFGPRVAAVTSLLVAVLFASTLVAAGAQTGGTVNALSEPIIDRGVTIELAPLLTIPPDAFGQPRINQFALQGDRLFAVTDLGGRIYEIVPQSEGELQPASPDLFFDVASAINATPGRQFDTSNTFHGGLRSVAFHPEFETNGLFYTSVMERRPANPAASTYLSDVPRPNIADGVVVEWRVDPVTGEPDASSYREVFRVGIPAYDHPIKQMAFNPFAEPGDADFGLLYVAHGDGSSQPAPEGGGVRNDALGKILRVDPLRQADGSSYGVPTDNPFVGDPSMLDEVYSLGHRNPHHLAFALDAGGLSRLIVAEVGRDNVEEINLIEAGANYGWSFREGTFVHLQDEGDLITGVAPLPANEADFGFTFPAAQYGHVGSVGAGLPGQGVAGGYVVANGSPLDGEYFYSDFPISGRVYSSALDEMVGAVTRLDSSDPTRDEPNELTQAATGLVSVLFDDDSDPATPSQPRDSLLDVFADAPSYDGSGRADVRFGQGSGGELYVSSKKNGVVYLVVNSVAPTPEVDPVAPTPPIDLCEGLAPTVDGLIGTAGPDVIIGTVGPDVIRGNGGDDVICGRGGADDILGGAGNDLINAGWGADAVFGGDGDDILLGGPGLDNLEGGLGEDTIRGGRGGDRIVGGGGNDLLYGGDQPDRIFGFSGDDELFGGGGNDNLRGGAGADAATGGAGVDRCDAITRVIAGCEALS